MSYDNRRQGECTMEYRDGWERFAGSGSVADYLSFKEIEREQLKRCSEENGIGNKTEEGYYAGLYHGDGDGFKDRSRG